MNLAPSNRITPWVAPAHHRECGGAAPAAHHLHLPGAGRRRSPSSPDDALRPAVDLRHLHVRPRRAPAPARQHARCCSCSARRSRAGWAAGRSSSTTCYCGVGGGGLRAGALRASCAVGPFVGASGAVLGVALAFAMYWPDAELIVFPLPVPIRARTLVDDAGRDSTCSSPSSRRATASPTWRTWAARAFGYLFFRLQGTLPPQPRIRRPARSSASSWCSRAPPSRSAAPRSRRRARAAAWTPIRWPPKWTACSTRSARRASRSLTPAERRFLDEVSRQKKQDPH